MTTAYDDPLSPAVKSTVDKWILYERAKQDWIASHPDSTPAEYTAAIQKIAGELGV